MLRKIPDSAVPFAREGVLPARRLGHADRAERLERQARQRAADIATSAREEAERQFEAASRAGYRDGMQRALSAWVPKLAELLADEAQLKARTRQALERYLRDALTDAGVEAALITRCCEGTAAQGDANAVDAWTLYVPEDREPLVAYLADTATSPLQVRRGEAPWPVLERGDVVVEIDPLRPAGRRLAELLDEAALTDVLEQRASLFAEGALRSLRADVGRKGIRHLRNTGDTT